MKRMSAGFAAAVSIMALIATACGSDDNTTADVSATAGTSVSASASAVATGSPGTAADLSWIATAEPPPSVTPSLWDPRARLEHAISLIEFQVKLPTYFPTSADKLGSASAGSDDLPPHSVRILNLLFGGRTVTIDGKEVLSTMSYVLNDGALKTTRGDLVSDDVSGYKLYKEVVGTASDGTPIRTSYMALDANSTVTVMFTGEQPTMDGLTKMLGSLKVVKP
jgi:hypothetical protein